MARCCGEHSNSKQVWFRPYHFWPGLYCIVKPHLTHILLLRDGFGTVGVNLWHVYCSWVFVIIESSERFALTVLEDLWCMYDFSLKLFDSLWPHTKLKSASQQGMWSHSNPVYFAIPISLSSTQPPLQPHWMTGLHPQRFHLQGLCLLFFPFVQTALLLCLSL